MRAAVLPRDEAARVITAATANGAWAISATNLALAIPLLIETLLRRGLGDVLPVPLLILAVLLALTLVAGLWPRPVVVAGFLVVAFVGTVLYQVILLNADPALGDAWLFLVNRPAISLVLVAVGSTTWLSGLVWILVGFLTSTAATVVAALLAQTGVRPGWGPLLFFVFYVVVYATLARIQYSRRRSVPRVEELEDETRRLSLEENLRDRVTAAVHDTLLNDLALVMNAPDTLDDRVRQRLRDDLETLRGAEWLRAAAEVTDVDDADAELRNQVMLIVSDLQWRGLTVHVTGAGPTIHRLGPEASRAIVAAARACLENVLRHSGVTAAEVSLAATDDEVTVMIADEGAGFELDSVPDDRLGLRHSVVERIRAVGGTVKVWSSPGAGTSVMMRVPLPREGSTP